METLKNYVFVSCTCISINAKRNEEKLSWLIFIIYNLVFFYEILMNCIFMVQIFHFNFRFILLLCISLFS